MKIAVCRRTFTAKLALATGFFSAMGIMVEIASSHHGSHGWLTLFDLDKEWNFPTIYSALLLFAASALLALIAGEQLHLRAAGFRYWIGLAAIFCFFGFDELFSIHNSAKRLVPVWFKHIGLLNLRWDLRWVVIGIPATLLIVILFIPFVLRLPRRTALGIIVAGMIYVGAALGVETIGGWWIGKHTKDNWTYSALVVIEESFEMIGALAFLGVLLAYIKRELGGRARLGPVVLQIEECNHIS
jgi:hypothetical protein